MSKTVIITGANRGLGYETAKSLAGDPAWRVVLACRDMASATEAAGTITRETGNPHVVPMKLDLASLQAVPDFAAAYKARDLAPLKSIVCNAGVSKTTVREKSADGQNFAHHVAVGS